MYIESESVELKERVNEKLVREIVAFLNTNGGKIYIGIKDDGEIIGTDDIDYAMRFIADVISTQIDPMPLELVSASLLFDEKGTIIQIDVKKGIESLYCIKRYGFSPSGCLMRVGTTCREMPTDQINRRFLQRFSDVDLLSETRTNLENLTFSILKSFYLDKGYSLNEETYKKNLYLVKDDGKYNVLGELMSDQNRYSFIFVKFKGTTKASISQRSDYGMKSLLFAYEQMMNRISSENICKTDTSVRPRIDTYLFDIDCVNEAIVNAIAHNDWLISEPQVSFYSNRIEVLSHGGLKRDLSVEDFYDGVSKPKNTRLMKILSDLDIVDHTGHGIPTIVAKYGREAIKITDNHILVIIPFNKSVLGKNVDYEEFLLNNTELSVLELLESKADYNAVELADILKKSKKTIERSFASLQEKKRIERVGSKKTGYWKVK